MTSNFSSWAGEREKDIIFLAQTLKYGNSGDVVMRITKRVPKGTLLPFACGTSHTISTSQINDILPFGFEDMVQLENHKTSYKIVDIPQFRGNSKKKVCPM